MSGACKSNPHPACPISVPFSRPGFSTFSNRSFSDFDEGKRTLVLLGVLRAVATLYSVSHDRSVWSEMTAAWPVISQVRTTTWPTCLAPSSISKACSGKTQVVAGGFGEALEFLGEEALVMTAASLRLRGRCSNPAGGTPTCV